MSDSIPVPDSETTEPVVQAVRPHAELLTHSLDESHKLPLSQAPVQVPLRIIAVRASKSLEKRMISLGMPLGTEVEILHRRGHSVVLVVGSSRIALGSGMVGKIMVEVV
jgi:Fe2+ transport system protein FeoA